MDEPLPTIEPEEAQSEEERRAEVLRDMKEFMTEVASFDNRTRTEALEDLRYKAGNHWPDQVKRERDLAGRPCLVQNMIPKFLEQVLGDARQNKPAIEVHPVDSDGDPIVARILEDHIRNIEYVSNAEYCYDTSLEQAVDTGFGYFGLSIDYASDDTFEQEIRFRVIPNQFSVYFDPWCIEPDGSDAKRVAVTEMILRKDFEKRWPKAAISEVDSQTGDTGVLWWTKEQVRIAEFWRAEPIKKILYQVLTVGADGQPEEVTLNADSAEELALEAGEQLVEQREVDSYRIRQYLCSGAEILEEADYPGKYIPIFPVYGKRVRLDQEVVCRGLIRDMKSPQLAFDYWWTEITERIALSPKTPTKATPQQIEGHEDQWNQANRTPFPYLLYNPDPRVPGGGPIETPGPQIETGRVDMLRLAMQGLKDTSGIYDASLGAPSNETSGVAIRQRQHEGDIGTFYFVDNLRRAITLAGKCLVDLIPKVYSKKRLLRLRNKDNSTSLIPVNQPVQVPMTDQSGQQQMLNGEPVFERKIFDLTVGKFDVVVTTGPAYATQREQTADMLGKILQSVPNTAPVVLPRLLKHLDVEDAEEMGQELKQMMTPQPPPMPAGAPGAPGVPIPPGAGEVPAPGGQTVM